MRLKDFGGEFSFLERVIGSCPDSSIIVPNGDDAAVFRAGSEILAVSTDTIVEGDHFSFDYFTPTQVGIKAIESAASDIVAVGGKPRQIYISLCLPDDIEIERLDEIYHGINQACLRLGAYVLGGDTTHGAQLVISVTVIGIIESEDRICPRSAAKPGDLIYVTGPLGSSMAGLRLFQKKVSGFEDIKKYHLEPSCRIDIIDRISPYANAMIDISDGLSSEIHHICRQSNCGAIIHESKVPLLERVIDVATMLGEDPYSYAYSGGEDYQLLYTIPSDLKDKAVGTEIGKITRAKEILLDGKDGMIIFENRGYDHFRGEK